MAGEKDVKIRINTEANTAGAKEAQQSMASLEAEVKRLKEELRNAAIGSREFEELSSKIGAAERKINDAGERSREFARKAGEAKESSRNMGGAVLEASRAFEDMQYGIRGALNNLPVLIAQLGGSAGLAGVISLVAVTASILGPKLLSLGDDASAAEPKFKGFKEALKDIKTAADELKQFEAGFNKKSVVDAYNESTKAIDLDTKAINANLEAFRNSVKAQAELDKIANQRQIERVKSDAATGKISASDADKLVGELKRQQAEREIATIKILGEANVEQEKRELEAIAAKQRAAEAAKVGAQQEVEARKEILEKTLPKFIELADKLSGFDSSLGMAAPIVAGSVDIPGGFNTPAAMGTLGSSEKAAGEVKSELERIAGELRAAGLGGAADLLVNALTKDSEGIGKAAMSIKEKLEKGDKILDIKSEEEIEQNKKKLAEAVNELAGKYAEQEQKLEQRQASEAQNTAQASAVKSTQIDTAREGEQQQKLRELDTKAVSVAEDFMRRMLDQIPGSADNPAVQAIVDQVKKLEEGGINQDEIASVQGKLAELASLISGDNIQRKTLYQGMIEALNGVSSLQSTIIEALRQFKQQQDEDRRTVNGIKQQMGNQNH